MQSLSRLIVLLGMVALPVWAAIGRIYRALVLYLRLCEYGHGGGYFAGSGGATAFGLLRGYGNGGAAAGVWYLDEYPKKSPAD